MPEGEFSMVEPVENTEEVEKNALKSGESDSDLALDPKPINTFDDIRNKQSGEGANTPDDLRREKISLENESGREKDKHEIRDINSTQKKWDEVSKEIEKTADAEGYRIDEGIKDPVIALNAFEINTGQSCEGHLDSGMSAPWIRIEAPNEPEERFVGQNETFEKVAQKYNMSAEETKRMFNMDAYWEAIHECQKNGETKEFQKWKEESGKLLYGIQEILSDFYRDRQVPESVKIKVDTENLDDMAEGSFEIYNGGGDYRNISEIKLTKEEKEALDKRIIEYRKEMQEFAGFLKDKFFKEGESYINKKRNNAQDRLDQEKAKKILEKINSPKNNESNEAEEVIKQEKKAAMERLAGHSFKTEKGSIYTYDDQGRTSRLKTKTGEQHEKQDITIFLDLTDGESRLIMDAIHSENPELKKKVYVVERSENDKPKIIRTFSEVNDPRNLYLSIYNKDGRMVGSKRATLKPTVGYTVFDTRHFKDGDEWKTERHLGHKVTEIN